MGRRGESAGSAAVFIIVVALLIVLYMVFLPEQERERLLQDGGEFGRRGCWCAFVGATHWCDFA
ncbi:MAG: hypothetical protein HC945_01670 [Nitrosarchaeum sp.]|nr:hypothetical protein [Nitrosarchaeum sp.]